MNSTAEDLFERARKSYERRFNEYGRTPSWKVSPTELSLDFEIETQMNLKMTPELLLERAGIVVKGLKGDDHTAVVWPKVSEYFSVGVDGTGHFVKEQHDAGIESGAEQHVVPSTRKHGGHYRQGFSSAIELESIVMSTSEAMNSDFTSDLENFLETVHNEKEKKLVTRTSSVMRRESDERWRPLNFEGAQGIVVSGGMNPNKPCGDCYIQWTVGIPLQHVSSLLRTSGDRVLHDVINNADELCESKKRGCKPEYHAFISLAAYVLKKVRGCGCTHPKWCMKSWLVRTHFGDLAMHLKAKLGFRARQFFENLPADVMQVGQFEKTDLVLPDGTIDYLHFPELAEIAGMVHPRNNSHDDGQSQLELQDMPTDMEGLLSLSKRMLHQHKHVAEKMNLRPCGLHGRTTFDPSSFTVNDWLQGVARGKDLMSDYDSALSKSSYSHLLWRSMGNWRMKPRSDRVYLECRKTGLCLFDKPHAEGPARLIQKVAKRMQDFENEIMGNAGKAPAKKAPPPPTSGAFSS